MTRKAWVGAAAVAAVAAGWYFAPDPDAAWAAARDRLADWRAFAGDHFVEAAAAFMAVYFLSSALSLPIAVPLSLLGGAVFGRWAGALLSVTAATLGGAVPFLLARYVLRDWVRRRFGPRLAAVDAGIARDGWVYLLSLRLIPVVPYTLTNLAAGLTPLPLRAFLAASWAGMLPGTFVFANAGAAVAGAASPRDVLSGEVLVALGLLGGMVLVIRWLARRA